MPVVRAAREIPGGGGAGRVGNDEGQNVASEG